MVAINYEKIQLAVACTAFFFIGQFGARFYETSKIEGHYTRAQYMRLIQYVLGLAPLLILGALFVYNKASGMDEKNNNHMYVYILYSFVGLLGLATCSMLLADISKSKFSAESTDSTGTDHAKIAKVLASIGVAVFAIHVVASLGLGLTKNTAEVFSPKAFMTAIPSKSSGTTTAAPAAFGMNDLLSFGKRRKRYL